MRLRLLAEDLTGEEADAVEDRGIESDAPVDPDATGFSVSSTWLAETTWDSGGMIFEAAGFLKNMSLIL